MKVVIIAGDILRAVAMREKVEEVYKSLFAQELGGPRTIEGINSEKDFLVAPNIEIHERIYLFEERRGAVGSSLEALRKAIKDRLNLRDNQVVCGILF